MINEYTTKKYKTTDHSAFGGVIYEMDFETNFRPDMKNKGSVIASSIISAWKFDNYCRNILLNRRKEKNIWKT